MPFLTGFHPILRQYITKDLVLQLIDKFYNVFLRYWCFWFSLEIWRPLVGNQFFWLLRFINGLRAHRKVMLTNH